MVYIILFTCSPPDQLFTCSPSMSRSSHPLAGLEFATASADHLPLPDASVQVGEVAKE